MTNNSINRETGRALVLAAIMVLSVGTMSAAFTGVTTAQDDLNPTFVDADEDPAEDAEGLALNVTDDNIDEGENATFDITVTNYEDDEITATVELELGSETWNDELTIAGNDSASITFEVADLSAGDHDWIVTAANGDFNAEETCTLTVFEDADNGDADDGDADDSDAADGDTDDDDAADGDANDSDAADGDADDSDADDGDADAGDADDGDADAGDANDDGTPGFGVAVALVALLAAAMLALHRQD